jgi:beta-carotene ketolase (CrtW type)
MAHTPLTVPAWTAQRANGLGLLWAVLVVLAWGTSLVLALQVPFDWANPWLYAWVLLQTHLYTGMFITAHDAMHGTVHPNRRINTVVGWVCAGLFAFNYYPLLLRKHRLHHRHVATAEDPDFYPGGFWPWYLKFLREYLRWPQFLLMAITFNVLQLWLPLPNLIAFWMLPAVLSTLQLFFFGTYLPHRAAPDNLHHSRSQRKHHLWAFLSCYFFGYHYEHHAYPATPWWQLWRTK